jgi:hypothetical protein
VVNGECIVSPGHIFDQTVHINGEAFDIDLYTLPLGEYDMVLGIQWLGMLGLILWNFARHTMVF